MLAILLRRIASHIGPRISGSVYALTIAGVFAIAGVGCFVEFHDPAVEGSAMFILAAIIGVPALLTLRKQLAFQRGLREKAAQWPVK